MADAPPSRFARVRAVAQLIYSELQYWCVGLMPESYHWKKGNAWDILGNHQRAAVHLAGFLLYADNAYVRGRLAYCYARLGVWAEASQQYEKANQKYPHPDFALGHAKAELRLGNNARAVEILASVRSSYPRLSQEHMEDVAFLEEEMRHGWSPETSRNVV